MARPPYPSDKQDQFMIRFPDGMRDRLKALAQENKRSLNAQIVSMLEYALDEMNMAAGKIEPSQAGDPSLEFLRKELLRTQSMLEMIIGDFDDPNSDLNQVRRERRLERGGSEQSEQPDPRQKK